MSVRIFVYGTLMPGHGNFERFLEPFAKDAQPAKVKGELYNLGGVPGLVDRGSEWVHGYTMTVPAYVLASLDGLEGVSYGLYYRSYKPVYTGENKDQPNMAHTYFIPANRVRQGGLKKIHGGTWR